MAVRSSGQTNQSTLSLRPTNQVGGPGCIAGWLDLLNRSLSPSRLAGTSGGFLVLVVCPDGVGPEHLVAGRRRRLGGPFTVAASGEALRGRVLTISSLESQQQILA